MEIKLHLFLSTTSTCGLHFPHPIILINLKYIFVQFLSEEFLSTWRYFQASKPLLRASRLLQAPSGPWKLLQVQNFKFPSGFSLEKIFRRSLLVLNFSVSVSHHSLTLKKSFVRPLIFIFFSLSTLFWKYELGIGPFQD